LRQEDFNLYTEKKLASHPYVLAAEDGTLGRRQLRAFGLEQIRIQYSDEISFSSLSKTWSNFSQSPEDDLFGYLADGERYSKNLLNDYLAWLNISDDDKQNWNSSSLAQAYPAMWGSIALKRQHAIGAAAVAVNVRRVLFTPCTSKASTPSQCLSPVLRKPLISPSVYLPPVLLKPLLHPIVDWYPMQDRLHLFHSPFSLLPHSPPS